jgi:hypothetical protein
VGAAGAAGAADADGGGTAVPDAEAGDFQFVFVTAAADEPRLADDPAADGEPPAGD